MPLYSRSRSLSAPDITVNLPLADTSVSLPYYEIVPLVKIVNDVTGEIYYDKRYPSGNVRVTTFPDEAHYSLFGKSYVNKYGNTRYMLADTRNTLSSPEAIALFLDVINEVLGTLEVDLTTVGEHIVSASDRTIYDNSIPNFLERSKAGEIFNNPMQQLSYDIVCPVDLDQVAVQKTFTVLKSTGKCMIVPRADAVGHPAYLSPDLLSDIIGYVDTIPLMGSQNAINSAFGNINQADLQALVAAGEGKKTVTHLASVFSRILRLYKAIKKGKWNTIAPKTFKKLKARRRAQARLNEGKTLFRKELKAIDDSLILDLISEAWLEARYAWRPLVIDVTNTIKLVMGEKSLHPRQTFRGFDEDHSTDSHNFTYTYSLGKTAEISMSHTIKQSVRAGCLCEATRELGFADQTSATNLIDAGVELIPFSFILQWFINIGGLLFHLRPKGAYELKASWDVLECVVTTTGTITVTSSDGSIKIQPFQLYRTRKIRSTGNPATLFSIDIDLNFSQIADLTLIARKLMSR